MPRTAHHWPGKDAAASDVQKSDADCPDPETFPLWLVLLTNMVTMASVRTNIAGPDKGNEGRKRGGKKGIIAVIFWNERDR